MFFPSLPFMRVILFPSFVLGNASVEGGASLALLSLFFFLLLLFFLPLSHSPAFSSAYLFLLSFCLSPLSLSIFLFSFLPITHPFFFLKLLPSLFFFSSFLSSSHSVFLLCPFFFFFEGTVCTECFSRCTRGHH